MKRVLFALSSLLLLTLSAAAKPNILWVYVDDMNDWFSCYGETLIETPNLDALAAKGVRFTRAYAPAPVCSATRSAVMTGCMQTTGGFHNHRTEIKKDLPEGFVTIPQLFREAGYSTFNNRKTDYNFKFDPAELYSPELAKIVKTNSYEWMSQLKDMPFFGQLQFWGGKVGGEAGGKFPAKSRVDQAKVAVPPQYPDTPVFRNAIARHLEQTKLMDEELGKLVSALKEHGLWDNTIIFFFTDHGYQLPRAKQFLFEEGVRVPLVVANLPERKAEVRSDLVNLIDLGPSSLQLCDIKVPDYMEGRAVLAKDYQARDYTVVARDRLDYTIDRIRAVISPRFKYIKNFHPERPLTSPNYRDGYASFKELHKLHQAGELTPLQEQIFFEPKPEEELYDLKADPNELKNLAKDPAHAETLAQHRQWLAKWIKETGDLGQKPESDEELKAQLKRWKKRAVAPEFDRVR